MRDFGINGIEMAHAFEGYACDASRAARDADFKMYGVDECRLRMESWDYRLHRAFRPDPSPLWHEHVRSARVALGAGASERDVREYAARLEWGLPPHGGMGPVTPNEWAAMRGLVASWLYRKGMSEAGLKKYIEASPEEFYPDDKSTGAIAPGVLVELVQKAYDHEVKASVGAPFLPPNALFFHDLFDDQSELRNVGRDDAAEETYSDMLLSKGVDRALLRKERLEHFRKSYVYVPISHYFAQALAELGPGATERDVSMRAAVLHYVDPAPPPWEICLERAYMALGREASVRAIHEYAARFRLGITPHAGDVLGKDAWIQRQADYLVDIRYRLDFLFNPEARNEFVGQLVEFSYVDAPKDELRALLIDAAAKGVAEADAAYMADQQRSHAARMAGEAAVEGLLAGPNPPTIDEIHRAGCEFRLAWRSPTEASPTA